MIETPANQELRDFIEDFIKKEVEQLIKMQELLTSVHLSDFQESEEFQQ